MSVNDTKTTSSASVKTQYPVGLDVHHSYDVQRGQVSKWKSKNDGTVYFCIARAPEPHAVFGSVTMSQWYDDKGVALKHPGDYHWGKQTYVLGNKKVVAAIDNKEFPNYVENHVWLQGLTYVNDCVAPATVVIPDAVLMFVNALHLVPLDKNETIPRFVHPTHGRLYLLKRDMCATQYTYMDEKGDVKLQYEFGGFPSFSSRPRELTEENHKRIAFEKALIPDAVCTMSETLHIELMAKREQEIAKACRGIVDP